MTKANQTPQQLLIGAHTSAAGGAYQALLEGQQIGATTIQLFTANQKRWEGKPFDSQAIEMWQATVAKTGIKEVMSHDSYLINLGTPNPENLAKSKKAFLEELVRCHQLDITYLNFHPGAALDGTVEECLDTIVESLLQMEDQIAKGSTKLLLETTAGQGSAVGNRFEHLAYIVEKVHRRIPIGVCIDTCHIFVAGYDLRTPEACDATLNEFDKIVGLKHLCAFHLNDSVKGLGSRVDRHAILGHGTIGLPCFEFLMTDARTRTLPKYLETPEGPERWKVEIAMLRDFASHAVQ